MIRTTNNHLYRQADSNIFRLTEERNRYLEQISSGRKFSRISDSPVDASQVMVYQTEELRISNLGRNLVRGDNRLALNDTVIEQASGVLSDSRHLLAGWPGTHDQGMRQALIEQMKQYEDQLYGLANTVDNGNAIFAGFQGGSEQAYSRISTSSFHLGAVYNGDGGRLKMEIGNNQTMQTNVIGGGYTLDGRSFNGLFKLDKGADNEARDIFELYSRIIDTLESGTDETFQAASHLPLPSGGLRDLANGELTLFYGDGSSQAIAASHSGGDAAAVNAWNINDYASATGVTARLRAQVTAGSPVPNFAAADDRTMAEGDLKINGVAIGAVEFEAIPTTGGEAAANAALQNIRTLAAAINRKSGETGVWASYTPEYDGTASYDYQLVLTSNDADGEAITIELANDAPTQTGLGTVTGVTDYYPGADGDGANNLGGGSGTSVYNRNNGTITLESDDGFSLQENSSGALRATLGLDINSGLDTHQAKTRLDSQMAQLDAYLDNFTAIRASVAVRRNHLKEGREGLDKRKLSLQDATDELQRADIEEAAMKYYAAQNYYEATLASTSRVINTSILNYLR